MQSQSKAALHTGKCDQKLGYQLRPMSEFDKQVNALPQAHEKCVMKMKQTRKNNIHLKTLMMKGTTL